jgi:hypothetical protein
MHDVFVRDAAAILQAELVADRARWHHSDPRQF